MDNVYLDTHGSSPLTRGTQNADYLRDIGVRFIPAYAGNSSAIPNGSIPETVHPRLRGELVRFLMVQFLKRRFIPAYAGNSSPDSI